MKPFFCFLISIWVCIQIDGQSRYLQEVFDDVSVTEDVVYGSNIELLSFPVTGKLSTKELKVDIYEPVGDTLSERPLVIVIHDGYFLPPQINGSIIGSRKDSSVVEICTQLAKRGFTSAAISYRFGWNPAASTAGQIGLGLFQAIYRAVQDGRTAVRFFKKNHAENGNIFNIDPEKITVWGIGSGGVVALNMVALSDIDEIVSTTNSPAKFIFDSDGDGIPDIPMVLEEIHGDIEGKNLTIAPFEYLIIKEGDTTSLANYPEYDSEFQLAVNIGGAVGDISWLEDNSVPIISFQHIFDGYWPYADDILVFHPGLILYALQGSEFVGAIQESLGNNQEWKDSLNSSNPLIVQAELHSSLAGHDYYEGLYPFVNPANSSGIYEGVVVDWWDPKAISPIDSLPWDETPYPGSNELTFHDYMLILNEGMSAEKARNNIDTIINYFAPRACITLDLNECNGDVFTSVEDVSEDDSSITSFPNPTSGIVNIVSQYEEIHRIELYDSRGEMKKVFNDLNSKVYSIDIGNLESSIYYAKIFLDSKTVYEKFILN